LTQPSHRHALVGLGAAHTQARHAAGLQFAPTDVGRDFTAAMRRLVRADWLRATTDITDMQGVRQS
jgi:hypothetical protein